MAYDASNTNNDQQQVAGANPLSQGGGQSTPMAQGDQQGQTGPSTPATIQAGQSSTQAAQSQQPQQSNKPASSGMFTNIKSYVEKNQPAAQKMAGAVSQNVGDQASQIREQAEKKAQIQKDALAANNKTLEQEANWASTNIQNVIGGQPQTSVEQRQELIENLDNRQEPKPAFPPTQNPPQPVPEVEAPPAPVVPEFSEEDMARMQGLVRGEVQGITQVGDLNLSQQQARIQALQNMAQGANTEQGRMNLLKNTFGNQGANQYTRGLSGLDQLVVSGDQSAREQLVTGTQGQVQGVSQDVQGIQQDVNAQRMAQEQALRGFGSNIQDQILGAQTGLEQGWDQYIDQQKMARGQIFSDYNDSLEQFQTSTGAASDYFGGMSNFRNLSDYGKALDPSKFSLDESALAAAGVSKAEYDSLFKDLPTSGSNWKSVANNLGARKNIINKLATGLKNYSQTDPFLQQLQSQGLSLDNLTENRDLTRSNIAKEEDVTRFNLLRQMLGQSDVLDKGNYTNASQLQDYLDSLRSRVISGSGPRTTK